MVRFRMDATCGVGWIEKGVAMACLCKQPKLSISYRPVGNDGDGSGMNPCLKM
jgi:hypothetical protein